MKPVNLLPAERRKADRKAPKLTPLHGAGLGMLVGALALGYWATVLTDKSLLSSSRSTTWINGPRP